MEKIATIQVDPPRAHWLLLARRPVFNATNLEKKVTAIINEVKEHGDEAVKSYSRQFHGFAPESVWVTVPEIRAASRVVPKYLKQAILMAKEHIEKFHRHQVQGIKKVTTAPGITCWRRDTPIEKIGLYIPGGSAPLFSTLLMLAIPAKLAGCKNIIVTTPAQNDGSVNAVILYVAGILGLKKIYKSGGAQAIAALAFGTQTLDKVDKIFGPGNQYVTCAKKLVSNAGIAIDMLAGPSELAIYADASCEPAFVAADLLSQAEHGIDSQVVLVAASRRIIDQVVDHIKQQLPSLPRKDIIEKSLLNGRLMVMTKKGDAFDFLNQYAPEHLIIASKDAEKLAVRVVNAGSVFLGNLAPESAGDYASGTNHSLPTNGTARAQAGVSVDSFVKKITFQQISKKGIQHIGKTVETMAAAEGLEGHKNAVSIRLKKISHEQL